eukprot:4993930-Prymnesium_polylepis.1
MAAPVQHTSSAPAKWASIGREAPGGRYDREASGLAANGIVITHDPTRLATGMPRCCRVPLTLT